jgi:hypothetical protein
VNTDAIGFTPNPKLLAKVSFPRRISRWGLRGMQVSPIVWLTMRQFSSCGGPSITRALLAVLQAEISITVKIASRKQ